MVQQTGPGRGQGQGRQSSATFALGRCWQGSGFGMGRRRSRWRWRGDNRHGHAGQRALQGSSAQKRPVRTAFRQIGQGRFGDRGSVPLSGGPGCSAVRQVSHLHGVGDKTDGGRVGQGGAPSNSRGTVCRILGGNGWGRQPPTEAVDLKTLAGQGCGTSRPGVGDGHSRIERSCAVRTAIGQARARLPYAFQRRPDLGQVDSRSRGQREVGGDGLASASDRAKEGLPEGSPLGQSDNSRACQRSPGKGRAPRCGEVLKQIIHSGCPCDLVALV